MSRSAMLCLLLILTLAFFVSCSGGSENLVTPETGERDVVAAEEAGTTACFGLWQVTADKATGDVDVVQLRTADKILNVLGFMEPPPLTSMDLDWADMFIDFPNNHIDVGVILKHPIPDDVFTGFDVRGVCFGPVVENSDGLTIITGPEYFSGVPLGYQDGLLGAPAGTFGFEGLAGYKYFCEGLGEDEVLSDFFSDTGNLADRGKFGAGANVQRNYSLDWDDTGYGILVFNYAIYANYDWPTGDTPWDVDDWDITAANSAEAFCCNVTELANSLYYADGSGGGGDISLQIEAWDWQGDISRVTIESDGVIAQTDYDVALGVFPSGYSYGFEFYAVPGTPTSVGDLDILITVTDSKTFGECWFMDMLPTSHSLFGDKVYNCFIHTTTVIDCPPAVITDFDPDYQGQTEFTATITGTFMDGSLLAAKLTKTGESDIVGTVVTFVDTTQITADFDTSSAAAGLWDVEVTNGCGTPGSATEVIEIWSCGTMTPFTGSTYFSGSTYTTSPYYGGPMTCTRSGNTYLIGRCYSYSDRISARDASGSQGPGTYYDTNQGTLNNGMASTSTNMIYFTTSTNYAIVRQIQWTGSGWSGFTTKGTLPSPWQCVRIKVDDNDNPIVLARNTTNSTLARIYHWDGSGWGSGIDIPSTVHSTSYSYIRNFDYNPVLGHYVFVTRKPSSYYTDMYAMDSTGTVVHTENDVFSYNHSYTWYPGIYIDQDDPQCHFIVWGGYNTSSTTARPVVRYDAVYGNKTTGSSAAGGSSYQHPGTADYGAWATDTNRFFTRSYNFYWCILTMPVDW